MKGMKAILSSAFSVTIILILLAEFEVLTWAEVLTILPPAILVCITGWYAVQNYRMAEANEKMAKEMKEQRYDAVRPIIDIKNLMSMASHDEKIIKELTLHAYGDYSCGMTCILHNIGVGPATDVYSFIQTATKEQRRWSFGALAKDIVTEPFPLTIKQEDSHMLIEVYYRDIYSQYFISSREVEKSNIALGPLKTRCITKDEFQKALKNIKKADESHKKREAQQ